MGTWKSLKLLDIGSIGFKLLLVTQLSFQALMTFKTSQSICFFILPYFLGFKIDEGLILIRKNVWWPLTNLMEVIYTLHIKVCCELFWSHTYDGQSSYKAIDIEFLNCKGFHHWRDVWLWHNTRIWDKLTFDISGVKQIFIYIWVWLLRSIMIFHISINSVIRHIGYVNSQH